MMDHYLEIIPCFVVERTRLTDEKNLDQNNLQRLYEPSLLDENIYIKDILRR